MNKEYLQKLYSAYKLVIFPAIVALSCLVLIMVIILPQILSLIKNRETEGQLRSRFTILSTKAQALESLNEDDLNGKLRLALNLYPSDSNFSQVVGVLQEVSQKYGFNIGSLHLSGGTQAAKASSSEFSIKLDLTGPKIFLKDLITNIENAPRIMKIDSIDISSTKTGDNVNIGLAVRAYFQPLPNSFGGLDAPLPNISEKEEAVLATLAKVSPPANLEISVPKGKSNPFE